MKSMAIVSLLSIFCSIMTAQARIHSDVVEYVVDGTTFEGYVAYDDAASGARPTVLVVHDWMGMGDYARHRADQLAALGYVAFAVDMYGKGVRPKNSEEASRLAGGLKGDRALLRRRIAGALDFIRRNRLVDQRHIAAIGYCFGGTVALELARMGADISGVVSFHGGLDTPTPAAPNSIRAKVLVLHGADDPAAPAEQVSAFEKEMRDCGADWQLVLYGGARHGFTNPASGNDVSRPVAYNAAADRRSWIAMTDFFNELFK